MKHPLIFAVLLLTSPLFAGIENPLTQTLPGTAFLPYPGSPPSLPVNAVNTPTPFVIGSGAWSNGFTLKSVTNLVQLYSDQNSLTPINFDYELQVPVKITYYKNGNSTPVVINEVLQISYYHDPNQQREYQQTDAFQFKDACRVEVEIQPGI